MERKIDIKRAAEQLHQAVSHKQWFTAIGVGNNQILVYFHGKKPREGIPNIWKGYPVVFKKMSTPRLLSA
ncbi:MAG: hypothetical protein ACP59X_07295 [Solidesulfovibrio sp. DCME]|uniref:hypothetical protein n=1 Tax=Solidesulfovibrio sp. DCME TaxID=3447380 RepID=UPI003D1366F1